MPGVYNKHFGRSLDTRDKVLEALHLFIPETVPYSAEIIRALLARLKTILAVVDSCNEYEFFSSSLMIIYESEPESEDEAVAKAKAYMIDFSHTYAKDSAGLDVEDNYTFGIRSLIMLLKSAFDSRYSEED